MLKTCFGCCPIHNGVSAIAILNLLWNLAEMVKHSFYRYRHYDKIKSNTEHNHSLSVSNESNNTPYYDNDDSSNWTEFEEIPIMSGVFMDYLVIITFGWIFLELISNICLKQSTFKYAPHKIYAWLVIYYANLAFMIAHLLHFVTFIMENYDSSMYSSTVIQIHRGEIVGHILLKLLYIAIVGFEIFIVHSFYSLEKSAFLSDFVQIKWKYVNRGDVVSKGIDYTPASTFNVETSRQTQDGSAIPPYISNILQN